MGVQLYHLPVMKPSEFQASKAGLPRSTRPKLCLFREKLQKSKELPPGTIRDWKGGKQIKIAPGKWIPYTEGKTGRKAKTKFKLGATKREDRKRVGEYYETDPEKFIKSRDANVPEEFQAFVTPYTKAEYQEKGAKTYLSGDGKSGFVIAGDGDLISVFSSAKGRLGAMANMAVKHGATKLDCYGPVLPKLYEKYGFEVYETYQWDDQYAPPNWNYEKHGRPPVYMMRLKGSAVEAQKSKDEKPKPKKITEDEAKKLWDSMNGEHRKSHEDYAEFMDEGGEDDTD